MDDKQATLMIDLLCHQLQSLDRQTAMLSAIHKELMAIREATEQANEPDPDSEPDPFQTLNGPAKNPKGWGGPSYD